MEATEQWKKFRALMDEDDDDIIGNPQFELISSTTIQQQEEEQQQQRRAEFLALVVENDDEDDDEVEVVITKPTIVLGLKPQEKQGQGKWNNLLSSSKGIHFSVEVVTLFVIFSIGFTPYYWTRRRRRKTTSEKTPPHTLSSPKTTSHNPHLEINHRQQQTIAATATTSRKNNTPQARKTPPSLQSYHQSLPELINETTTNNNHQNYNLPESALSTNRSPSGSESPQESVTTTTSRTTMTTELDIRLVQSETTTTTSTVTSPVSVDGTLCASDVTCQSLQHQQRHHQQLDISDGSSPTSWQMELAARKVVQNVQVFQKALGEKGLDPSLAPQLAIGLISSQGFINVQRQCHEEQLQVHAYHKTLDRQLSQQQHEEQLQQQSLLLLVDNWKDKLQRYRQGCWDQATRLVYHMIYLKLSCYMMRPILPLLLSYYYQGQSLEDDPQQHCYYSVTPISMTKIIQSSLSTICPCQDHSNNNNSSPFLPTWAESTTMATGYSWSSSSWFEVSYWMANGALSTASTMMRQWPVSWMISGETNNNGMITDDESSWSATWNATMCYSCCIVTIMGVLAVAATIHQFLRLMSAPTLCHHMVNVTTLLILWISSSASHAEPNSIDPVGELRWLKGESDAYTLLLGAGMGVVGISLLCWMEWTYAAHYTLLAQQQKQQQQANNNYNNHNNMNLSMLWTQRVVPDMEHWQSQIQWTRLVMFGTLGLWEIMRSLPWQQLRTPHNPV